jgi:hypothetical protein
MPANLTIEELEALSQEDFDKLANTINEPTEEKEEVKAEKPATKEEPADEEVTYRREIDLGDGSGVQVFEGDSYEELIDNLAKAQEHATRKIRELTATKKAEAAKDELTPEQEFLLSQELTSKPSKALKSVIESTLGMSVEEFRKAQSDLQSFRAKQIADADAVAFVNATPDYYANPRNGAKISKYLNTFKLEPNVENYKKAFTDLSESGLLEAKPETNGASDKQDTPDKRIAEDGASAVVTQRKAGSSISTRGRSASTVQKGELTVADYEAMTMEQLEALKYSYR